MSKMRYSILCFIIVILKVLCSLVGGRYILEVKLFGYSNPSGSCSNCQGFCCDGVGIQPPNCSETLRCDSFFRYCLTPLEVAEPGNCFSPGSRFSLPNRDDRVLDFTQSNVALGLENPLQLPGLTNDYRGGVQLHISISDDDIRDGDFQGIPQVVDVLLVTYNQRIGEQLPRQNHTGRGFVTMDLSITAFCAQNFEGSNCSQCVPGFTGPECDVNIDDCMGMDCIGNVSQGNNNRFVGSIVGGVIGAAAVLTASTVTIIMTLLFVMKYRSKRASNPQLGQ